MKLSTIPPESLKLFTSIIQQKVMLTSAHQKGSQALANFVLETSNTDRSFHLTDEDEAKTMTALQETVKIASEGIEFINQLEVA